MLAPGLPSSVVEVLWKFPGLSGKLQFLPSPSPSSQLSVNAEGPHSIKNLKPNLIFIESG